MPVWKTRTEGGSWYGGGTQVPNCSPDRRTAIVNAFNSFIGATCLNCFPGLARDLRAKFETIEIDCGGSQCDGLDGFRSGNTINICTTAASRTGPVLLHELVHAVGGSELDSEAVEHACFNGNGATLPFGDDWTKFVSETSPFESNNQVRSGKYVIYNAATGEVFGNNGGRRGNRCFQHDGWIRTLDTGGGGGSWV